MSHCWSTRQHWLTHSSFGNSYRRLSDQFSSKYWTLSYRIRVQQWVEMMTKILCIFIKMSGIMQSGSYVWNLFKTTSFRSLLFCISAADLRFFIFRQQRATSHTEFFIDYKYHNSLLKGILLTLHFSVCEDNYNFLMCSIEQLNGGAS